MSTFKSFVRAYCSYGTRWLVDYTARRLQISKIFAARDRGNRRRDRAGSRRTQQGVGDGRRRIIHGFIYCVWREFGRLGVCEKAHFEKQAVTISIKK